MQVIFAGRVLKDANLRLRTALAQVRNTRPAVPPVLLWEEEGGIATHPIHVDVPGSTICLIAQNCNVPSYL